MSNWEDCWLSGWLTIYMSSVPQIDLQVDGAQSRDWNWTWKVHSRQAHRNDNDKALTTTQKQRLKIKCHDSGTPTPGCRYDLVIMSPKADYCSGMGLEMGMGTAGKTSASCVVWATLLCEIDDDWKLHRMGKPGIPRHDSVILTTIGDNTSIKGGRSWPFIKHVLLKI